MHNWSVGLKGFSCVYFSDFSTEQINTSFRATCSITIKPKGFADRDEVQGNPFLTAIFANHYTLNLRTMIKIETTTTPGTLGFLNQTTNFTVTITDEASGKEAVEAIQALQAQQAEQSQKIQATINNARRQQMDDARRTRRLMRTFGFLGLFLLLAIGIGLAALGIQAYVGQRNTQFEFMRAQGNASTRAEEVKKDLGGDIYRVRQVVEGLSGVTAAETIRLMLADTATTQLDTATTTLIPVVEASQDSTVNQ